MDDFLMYLVKKAEAEGQKLMLVIPKEDEADQELDEVELAAQEIARNNRILYEAHIKEGFTSEEAIKLVAANNI